MAGWRAPKAQRVVYVDAGSGEALLQERLTALAPETQPPTLVLVPGDAQVAGLPDVAVAEVSEQETVRQARAGWEKNRKRERYFL